MFNATHSKFPTLSQLSGVVITSMLVMSCAQSSSPTMSTETQTIVFGAAMGEPWRTLNDGVMGGLSEGEIVWSDTALQWFGQTRLENNGGFASLRGPWEQRDLRAMDQVVIRCRGNGGPFKLTLETSQRWWMPYAYTSFNPSLEWQDLVLEAKDFSWSQAQMGDLKTVTPESELGEVLRMGLMKYDGTAQPFELEVASIQFLPGSR
tara:strand:- start:13 stop:630 length:618 start_codon:yes stop_codon:yes gene_type:complete